MNARHGCWTIPQEVLDLKERVNQLEMKLSTKVVNLYYDDHSGNSFNIFFLIPAYIKTDTIYDLYNFFIDANNYYLQIPCQSLLTVNGAYMINILISAAILYPGATPTGVKIGGLNPADFSYQGITITPNNISQVDMHVVTI